MKLKNQVAVVTGDGSGIGRGTVLALARRGCHIALADIDAAALHKVAAAVRLLGVQVSEHIVDVTDRGTPAALLAAVVAAHGGVHILINNAGIADGGEFEDIEEAIFEQVMDINFNAVVRMIRAFLPHLRSNTVSRIVNISSLHGLIAPVGQSAYSASKFAVRGFSNAIRHELGTSSGGVTIVHPGGVATSIAKSARVPASLAPERRALRIARTEKMLRMPSERAGEIIVSGIAADRARVLVNTDAKIIAFIERLVPVSYGNILRRMMA